MMPMRLWSTVATHDQNPLWAVGRGMKPSVFAAVAMRSEPPFHGDSRPFRLGLRGELAEHPDIALSDPPQRRGRRHFRLIRYCTMASRSCSESLAWEGIVVPGLKVGGFRTHAFRFS